MKKWKIHHENFRFICLFDRWVVFILDRAAVKVKSTPTAQKLRIWEKIIFAKRGNIETSWDLDPFLQCCNACFWRKVCSSTKKQRNYMGLKITACISCWGQFWAKDTKRPKKKKKDTPNCHFWIAGSRNRVLGTKAGYCAFSLHSPSTKKCAKHLSHTSSPTPGYICTLTPYMEPAHHPFGEWAREPVTWFCSLLQPQEPQ